MDTPLKYTEEDLKAAVAKEKTRLLWKFIDAKDSKISDYTQTIKHTGGLLTQSMTFAYAKAMNDAVKILTKEKTDDKKA